MPPSWPLRTIEASNFGDVHRKTQARTSQCGLPGTEAPSAARTSFRMLGPRNNRWTARGCGSRSVLEERGVGQGEEQVKPPENPRARGQLHCPTLRHSIHLFSNHQHSIPAMAPGVEVVDAQPLSDGVQHNSEHDALAPGKQKIAVIGSGNWGSVAAKLLASNARSQISFHDEVRMWVYEEILPCGAKLSEHINEKKVNAKYLPSIHLGENVVADPDLENTVRDATMLVFVTPHQFIQGICRRMKGKIRSDAKAISLIKGMEMKREGPRMVSAEISEQLGIECSVLMGANIANEIAIELFSEATVGYRGDRSTADRWVQAFATPYFKVTAVEDVEGVELCGTLKNVVAIAAGLVDGLQMGNNTKAAIMRIGFSEMRSLSKKLFPSVRDTTFFESCGVADLITTCLGGRNRKVAEAFAKAGGQRSFDDLEAELLQGQKLQGVLTAAEVFEVLRARGWEQAFPLFSTVHSIATGQLPPASIVEYSEHTPREIEEADVKKP